MTAIVKTMNCSHYIVFITKQKKKVNVNQLKNVLHVKISIG